MPDTRTPAELAAWARQLVENMSSKDVPWEDDNSEILDSDCTLVAMVHHHANIRTVLRTGQDYSHGDAALIAAAPELARAVIQLAQELESERDATLSEVKRLREALRALHICVDREMGDSDLDLGDPLTMAMHTAAKLLEGE